MGNPLRSGERGASVLGSLVVLAMLGGVALVADLSNPPGISQTAASLAATTPPPPIPKKTPSPPPTGTFKQQQDKACQNLIAASAKAGKPDNIPEVTIERERGKKGTVPPAHKAGTGEDFESDRDGALVDLCMSVQKSRQWSEKTKNQETSYECKGRGVVATVEGDVVISTSRPYDNADEGDCVVFRCKPSAKKEKLDCVPEGKKKGYDPGTALNSPLAGEPITLDEKKLKDEGIGGTPLERESDALADATRGAVGKRDEAAKDAESKWKAYDEIERQLNECKENKGCTNGDALEKSLKEAEEAAWAAQDKYELSQKELDKLNAARVALDATGGPPGKDGKDDGADKGCTSNCGPTGPGGSGGPSGGGSGGGGGGSPGSTFPPLGGQPPPGNQTPRAPGTCSGGQTICSGNTLYSRNNQCVDTVVQYCPYGCPGTSESSGLLGLFGGSSGSGSQCAPPPQQCPQQPPQPNPEGCQNGTWRQTYGGTDHKCVTGWQCVPVGGGGQITASLSCQPQIADVGMTLAISYSCSEGTSGGSGFETGGAQSGSATTTVANPPSGANTATYTLTCTHEGRVATDSCNVQVARPSIVFVANPEAVASGETSALGWVTAAMNSCVVSSPDLPNFTQENANNTSVNGTATTPPLTFPATFFLTCETVSGSTREASTTVKIL